MSFGFRTPQKPEGQEQIGERSCNLWALHSVNVDEAQANRNELAGSGKMSICLQNSGSVNITLRVACTRSRSCLNRGKSQSTGLEKRNRVIWDVFKQKQHWPKVLAHSMRHFDCESLPTFHSSSKNC